MVVQGLNQTHTHRLHVEKSRRFTYLKLGPFYWQSETGKYKYKAIQMGLPDGMLETFKNVER
jgi:hypothetical protein